MNLYHRIAAATMIFAAGVFLLGCDVGTNPLLFDGSPAAASYRVDETSGTSYGPANESIDLEAILSSVDNEIDSVKVYNITLLVDSTDGTDPDVHFTDSLYLGADKVFSMNGTPLSAFATERSIFDPSIPGLSYGPSILERVRELLDPNDRPAPTVTLTFAGTASSGPLHFTVHLKIYVQVYTKAKK